MNHVGNLVTLPFSERPNDLGMIIKVSPANKYVSEHTKLMNVNLNVFYVLLSMKVLGPLFQSELKFH